MNASGILTIKPRTSKITVKTDIIGKGDPYLIITVGDNKFKTATHKNTQTPTFTESFSVKIDKLYSFHVVVMDEDFGSDDFVAETTVSLQDVIVKSKAVEIAKLSRNGKPAGEIGFELEFFKQS